MVTTAWVGSTEIRGLRMSFAERFCKQTTSENIQLMQFSIVEVEVGWDQVFFYGAEQFGPFTLFAFFLID